MYIVFPVQEFLTSPRNCGPCNFRAISHNSAQYENSCAQIRATDFWLETLLVQMNFWTICLFVLIKTSKRLNGWKHSQKELSLYHKFRFSDLYIFAIQYRRPFIFQTMNYIGPINLSLKYQRFTPSGCKDIEIRKFEFVTKPLL